MPGLLDEEYPDLLPGLGLLSDSPTAVAGGGLLSDPPAAPRRGTTGQRWRVLRGTEAGVRYAPAQEPTINAIRQWTADNPLDAAALAISPVPLWGDAAGLANDVRHYLMEPESRTWQNFAGSVAGLLPFVPAVFGMTKKVVGRAADALPMDEASRTARARDQGFAGTDWYHCTANDIEAFDLARTGQTTLTNPERQAVFLTTSPKVASDYAMFAQRVHGRPTAANVIDAKVRPENADLVNAGGKSFSREELDQHIKNARQSGHDALYVLNYLHSIEGADPKVAHMIAVLDPALIRSKRAAFDPAKISDSDILASLAGAELLAGSQFGDASDSPEPSR